MTETESTFEDPLVERIRNGDVDAWSDLVGQFEGRLLAYVNSRLANRSAAEDIVQETFMGFVNSLPNYDGKRSLESYLFSICAYKLTDHLRREGRRPTIPLSSTDSTSGQWQLAGNARVASSIARSGERRNLEQQAIIDALQDQVSKWQERGDWTKLKCIELLIVKQLANKRVAAILGTSEQQVANFKFDFISRTRALLKRQNLSHEVFPELYEED
ncbi:MAG: sigma-70 family RNA polymerase sigma factor [Pirellulaceae bacterium]|jgi:RNA polymerase sigma-70 factor, ECF subfamily|nr:sigma-70 family RNA polymerase sigma factor [Pirellulaceae bacterium]